MRALYFQTITAPNKSFTGPGSNFSFGVKNKKNPTNFSFQEKKGQGLKLPMVDCALLCSVRAVMAVDVGFPIGFPKTEGFRVCGPHTRFLL